jgi:hypothetical protein
MDSFARGPPRKKDTPQLSKLWEIGHGAAMMIAYVEPVRIALSERAAQAKVFLFPWVWPGSLCKGTDTFPIAVVVSILIALAQFLSLATPLGVIGTHSLGWGG